MTGDPAYTRAAVKAITQAAAAVTDFGGWLSLVLCRAAAQLGSLDALTAGRPGSWEAELVDRLARGLAFDDEGLAQYLTQEKDRIMTTCDPSRRPDHATQLLALDVVRRFVTTGAGPGFGAADDVHDLAADAPCPACAVTSLAQVMLAVIAATNGEDHITSGLSARILALVDAAQAELDAMN